MPRSTVRNLAGLCGYAANRTVWQRAPPLEFPGGNHEDLDSPRRLYIRYDRCGRIGFSRMEAAREEEPLVRHRVESGAGLAPPDGVEIGSDRPGRNGSASG